MQRSCEMYLLDISNSIDSINEFLGEERNFNNYESNKLLRRAVERELEIIGEAVNRILKVILKSIFPTHVESSTSEIGLSTLTTMSTILSFGE